MLSTEQARSGNLEARSGGTISRRTGTHSATTPCERLRLSGARRMGSLGNSGRNWVLVGYEGGQFPRYAVSRSNGAGGRMGPDRGNVRKHRVSFVEAISVFSDPLARIFPDEDHSAVERGRRNCCSSALPKTRKAASELSVPVGRPEESSRIMKNSATKAKRSIGLKPEYRFDYKKSKPNRFVNLSRPGSPRLSVAPSRPRAQAYGPGRQNTPAGLAEIKPRSRSVDAPQRGQ